MSGDGSIANSVHSSDASRSTPKSAARNSASRLLFHDALLETQCSNPMREDAPELVERSSVAKVGRTVELGLLRFREPHDSFRIERMVPREMSPVRHAADARLGALDRFEPDADLFRV